jgi:meiotically up-regulated gene 157 (Mug157) protein
MGLIDELNAAVGRHEDQVKDGIDKFGDMLDDKVGRQYASKVDNSRATSKA